MRTSPTSSTGPVNVGNVQAARAFGEHAPAARPDVLIAERLGRDPQAAAEGRDVVDERPVGRRAVAESSATVWIRLPCPG